MSGLLRFLGRLLFVTLLLTSAVLKIKQPNTYVNEVTKGYDTIRNLHPTITGLLPSTTTVHFSIIP
jgi:hypothetical protein